MRGTVSELLLDRGFGMIDSEGRELFFHRSALQGVDFSELMVGSPVELEMDRDPVGDEPGERPRAVSIRLADDAIATSDNEPLAPEKVHPEMRRER